MTKLFLIAGVAALATAAPATAGPGGRAGEREAKADQSGAKRADRKAEATERRDARAPQREARAERVERREMRAERPAQMERSAGKENRTVERRVAKADRADRAERSARIESRQLDRQAMRTERSQMREDRVNRAQERVADRDQRSLDRGALASNNSGFDDGRWANVGGRGLINGCPPGLAMKNNGCLPPGQAKKLVGTILPATLASALLPTAFGSLYPETPNYYYRYNDGYMYRVNRGSNLVDALLPLLGGGYLPGQYLPANYMNSYVPSSYTAFYPNTASECTRYANGVVYYVDCASGLIDNFMPLYDNGYGVGQMLPAGYGHYNVPSQYRDMYYDNADTGYWYAPGAIYQYDRSSSLITSVAALLSPGMSIGQQLPSGYGAYNVPLGYRDTYYDTPDSWYRYNNGNIYQVDPVTQLVTALVASALT